MANTVTASNIKLVFDGSTPEISFIRLLLLVKDVRLGFDDESKKRLSHFLIEFDCRYLSART